MPNISQTQLITLTAGGGTENLPVMAPIDLYIIQGTATLTSSWTIQPTGTPFTGMVYTFLYKADITLGLNSITIFGETLMASLADKEFMIKAFWNGTSWIVSFLIDITENGIIPSSSIANYSPSMSHAALKNLKDTGALEKGTWYLLNDYQTIYAQPDYNASGNIKATLVIKTETIEPLLLFATSASTFSAEALSINYPKDKLLYDIDRVITFSYGGATNAAATKGRIYERIDENNNRTDFDHRTVKFIRYNNGSGVYNVVNDNGNTAQEFLSFNVSSAFNNHFASVYPLSQFVNREFGNNVFYGSLLDNEFSSNSTNNTFSGNVLNNTFSGEVYQNTFSGVVNSSTFSGYVYQNKFSGDVKYSTFSGRVNTSTFSGSINTNTFSGYVTSNTFTHAKPIQNVTIDCFIVNKTITETLYPTLFGSDYHKEIVKDAITGDIYLKTESPSSMTPITYTLIV